MNTMSRISRKWCNSYYNLNRMLIVNLNKSHQDMRCNSQMLLNIQNNYDYIPNKSIRMDCNIINFYTNNNYLSDSFHLCKLSSSIFDSDMYSIMNHNQCNLRIYNQNIVINSSKYMYFKIYSFQISSLYTMLMLNYKFYK